MTHTSRPLRSRATLVATAAALLAAGLLAGCSAGAPDDDPTAGGDPRSSSAQMGECLRAAGYDVADPDFSQGIAIDPPAGVDVDVYVKAFETCAGEVGGDLGALAAPPDPAEVAELQEANLEVARCVREKGFEDFPDPVDGVFDGVRSTTSSPVEDAYLDCDAEFGPNGSAR